LGLSHRQAAAVFVEALRTLVPDLKVPTQLREFGVKEKDDAVFGSARDEGHATVGQQS